MRTKTLLIAAAAALTVSIISSQAQTVYSQNIVGYVNVQLPAGQYSMLVNPLTNTTLAADVILTNALQPGDVVLIWTGNGYYSDTYYGSELGSPPDDWYDGVNVTNAPNLSPGEGFFYQTGSGNMETNTFTGSVVLTNSIYLAAGEYSMVGSTPPIAGYLDSTNINMPLQEGDVVLIWSGNGYYSSTYYGADLGGPEPPDNGGTVSDWYDGVNVTNAPYVSVGQGYFYQTGSGNAEQWNQGLTVQ